MKRINFLYFILLFSLPAYKSNAQVILNSTKDAFVSAGATTTNYGSATELLIKVSPSGTADRKAYIGFDLSGKSASYGQIVLKIVKTSGDDAALMIRSAATSWTESAITWDTKPADGNNIAHGGYRIGDTLIFDITSYIKSKINNAQYAINLEIYTEDVITVPLAFASTENTTVKNRPVFCFYPLGKYDISTFKFINTTANVVGKPAPLPATNIDDITTTSPLDIYGGWTGAKFPATGFFRTKYSCGKWYMVDPLGNMFFMTALNSVEQGGGIVLPQALTDIGVNTMGKWSDEAINNIPYTPGMDFMQNFKNKRTEIGVMLANSIIPAFEADFPAFCDARAKILAARYVNDPFVIGYFLDNELPFYHDQLKASLALVNTNDQWIAADAWMKARYGATYNLSQITATDELVYQGYVCDKYYEVVSTAVRKYDPNHLLLGTRFHGAAKYHEYIMTAAGKYTDLISVNYYSEWEPDNVKLDMWLAKGNKPFFISEFYVKGNDLGLANGNGAGWLVATQTDRAKFYENFVLKLMKHPGCAGYHWFRYIDNHQTNKGVMDSTYKWFQPMVDAFKRINKDIYRLRSQLWFGNVNYNDKIDCAGTMCGTTVASVSIALTNGLNPSCAAAPLTYTATETNGGTAPVYQWKVNGINSGTNSKTFTSSTITNSSVVTCVMTSSYTCVASAATSNSISVTRTANVTPSVTIALTGGTNPSCAGTSKTFTATPTNGGTTPVYQWKVNGIVVGTNSASFTSSTLANSSIVTCTMTTSLTCVTATTDVSNAITQTVNTIPSANAGADQNVINSTATLSGNAPLAGATGNWTSTGTSSITAVSNPLSAVSGLVIGANTFRWTLTNGACSAFDEVTINRTTVTGIDRQVSMTNYTVYPNPFTGDVKLMIGSRHIEKMKLTITDVKGALVFDSEEFYTNQEIVLNHDIPVGVLLVNIIFGEEVKRFKIVKISQ